MDNIFSTINSISQNVSEIYETARLADVTIPLSNNLTNLSILVNLIPTPENMIEGSVSKIASFGAEGSIISPYFFAGCSNLSYIYAPFYNGISSYGCLNCDSLDTIILGGGNFGSSCFQNCNSLQSIYILDQRQNVLNSDIFNDTSFYQNNGNFYVPAGMVNWYKNNYTWLSNYVTALPESFSQNYIFAGEYKNSLYTIDESTNRSNVRYILREAFLSASFNKISSSSELSFPLCEILGAYAFGSTNISSVDLPRCYYINTRVFDGCSYLNYVSIPLCKSIGDAGFYGAGNGGNITFPACTSLGWDTFRHCNFNSLCFPILEQIPSAVFEEANISFIDCPICKTIESFAFAGASLTSFSFPLVTSVAYSAFYQCGITNVYLPRCTALKNSCFTSCYSLSSLSLPVCSLIEDRAFAYCSSLSNISIPECEQIVRGAFLGCTALREISLPKVKVMTVSCFRGCTALYSVSIPMCEILGGLENCTALSSIYAPQASFIATEGFSGCVNLSTIDAPLCNRIGSSAFYNCTTLQSMSLYSGLSIGSSAFYNCNSLSFLSIGGSSLCTLDNKNAFYLTPLSDSSYLGYYGSIYVPNSLVFIYKAATNWIAYADRIVGI